MLKSINGNMLRKMVVVASNILEQNKSAIDALNVFPVPDGDTGTNMSLTYKSVLKEVANCQNNNIDTLSEAISKGALKGARGNSGVILSQILKGMCSVLQTCTNGISTKNFAKAMKEGASMAYKAVTVPKEGTILTVIRIMAEAAGSASKKYINFEPFFEFVLQKGEEILQQTPEMLPVLKKAGVVDSGGRGIITIFNGFNKAILGDENYNITVEEAPKQVETDNEVIVNLEDLGDILYAYCTEFMVIEMHKKTTLSDIDKLRERLCAIGDSVICVGDLSLVKVHVHTNEPNKALGYGLELGELYNLKIENMLAQNRELKKQRQTKVEPSKPFGAVSVSVGKGLTDVFKDINCDEIISGGQTMNPSAEDIAKSVEKVPSNTVFVFPNNKNIIMAAKQAQSLTDKKLYVVETTSIPEGISAMLAMNPEATPEENFSEMNEAIKNVKSASVTYAVRSTSIDGFNLKQGEIIGLDEKHILTKGKNINETTKDLVTKLISEDSCNITLFYGSDVKEDDANKLKVDLETAFPEQEINMIYGGQPIYYYLISIE